MKSSIISIISLTMLLSSCATTGPSQDASLPALTADALCKNEAATISIAHETARVSDCQNISDTRFSFTIKPENIPVNNSAWYGFRVDPKTAGNLKVTLNYVDGKHRYRPKTSYDGKTWTLLSDDDVNKIDDKKVELTLDLGTRPFFVSGQEIFTKGAHDAWSDKTAMLPFVTQSDIGKSKDGHPIKMLHVQTEPSKKKPYVMWVGRQHPPEVTGALALIPFTEAVLSDGALAKRFRDNFDILIVPNMNPDGVTAGHWRHNKSGIDLNRDWGPFTQPETQAVKGALNRFETKEDRIAFFLDFHSTWRNLLYTQADDEPTSPPMFAHDWLTAVDENLDDSVYEFTREARHNSNKPISKNYFYENYGISSITYEVGDNTDRAAIKTSAKVFAEEMMKLLLKHETGS